MGVNVTLRDFTEKFKSRAECATHIGITPTNLNMLISRGRTVEQLIDGRWIIVNEKNRIFEA